MIMLRKSSIQKRYYDKNKTEKYLIENTRAKYK